MPEPTPAEHCGDMVARPVGGERTECVLRPGHSGSHADDTGMRWTPTPVPPPVDDPGPRCRYCGADCSDGRSWDGGDLYACGPCANRRAVPPPADVRDQIMRELQGCGLLTDGEAGSQADLDDLRDLGILADAVLRVPAIAEALTAAAEVQRLRALVEAQQRVMRRLASEALTAGAQPAKPRARKAALDPQEQP